MMADELVVSEATVQVSMVVADVVRPLRAEILRPGLPLQRSVYPTDDDRRAGHVAAVIGGEVVGVGSVAPEDLRRRPELTIEVPTGRLWRLRGMAVAATVRRRGVGGHVLGHLMTHARTHGADLVWANARDRALDFYLAHGWDIVSDGFMLPDIGVHHVVVLDPRVGEA